MVMSAKVRSMLQAAGESFTEEEASLSWVKLLGREEVEAGEEKVIRNVADSEDEDFTRRTLSEAEQNSTLSSMVGLVSLTKRS